MSNDIARLANLPAAAVAADTARAKSATPTVTAEAVAQPQAATPPAAAPPDVAQAVQRIQSYLKSVNHALEFRIDSDSGRTVVSVRDVETGDLIRQFPSEEVLRLAQLADEQQNLALLSETV